MRSEKTLQKIFEFQNQLQIKTHRLIFFDYWKDWTAFLSSFPIGILFAPRILKAILHCASTERITSLSDHKRTKMATLTQILRCIGQDLERFPVIKDVVIEA